MADAPADQNHVRSALAVLNTDTVQGTNLVTVKIKESNGGMLINDTDGISFTMQPVAARDQNYKHVLLWEGTDGLTYPLVADADGKVLIDY